MVSVLAAIAMLSARTWVQVPPTTSGAFLVTRFVHSTTETPLLKSMPCAPIDYLKAIRDIVKHQKKTKSG